MKIKHECSSPGCSKPGLARVENDKWLCLAHTQERINLPHNRALTQADQELVDFLDEGGKPS